MLTSETIKRFDEKLSGLQIWFLVLLQLKICKKLSLLLNSFCIVHICFMVFSSIGVKSHLMVYTSYARQS